MGGVGVVKTNTEQPLSLDGPEWSGLHQAYGAATDIPKLLKQLNTGDLGSVLVELWSKLCHQGDIYPASIAAVPFLVDAAKHRSDNRWIEILHLAAGIEAARLLKEFPLDNHLEKAYRRAIGQGLMLCAQRLDAELAPGWEPALPSIIETFRGFPRAGEAILSLEELIDETWSKSDAGNFLGLKSPLFSRE